MPSPSIVMLPNVSAVFGLFLACFLDFVSAQIIPTTNDCPNPATPAVLRATGSRQLLLTPGFVNGQYASNMDCVWILRAENQLSKVELSVFTSRIEDRLFTDCDDFIEVRDGDEPRAPLAALWCGSTYPFSITSSTDSLYIRFKSDPTFELRGANMSFVDYEPPECPPGWLSAPTGDDCYKFWSPPQKVTWVDAQRFCMYDRSNLLTLRSADEYRIVLGLYSLVADQPWIGYSDAQQEGTFASVNPTDAVWPSNFPTFGNDHEGKDCVYLDLNVREGVGYAIDDCRDQRSFICKKRKDGKTAPYPPPEAAVRQGFILAPAAFSVLNLWPLLIVFIILLLLILTPICYKKCCAKQKTRVEPEPMGGPLLATASDTAARSTTSVRSVSRMVEQNYGTDEVTVAAERTDGLIDDTIENRYMRQLEDARQRALPPMPSNGVHVTTKIPRLVSARTNAANRNGSALPPLDGRFDRPYIRMLDNVSAISLDEFWKKSDKPYVNNKVPSTAARPETGRTML